VGPFEGCSWYNLPISKLAFWASYLPAVSYLSSPPDEPDILLVQIYLSCMLSVSTLYLGRLQLAKEKGRHPGPSTGMHILKRARRTEGLIMWDIVTLVQLRTLVDLVARFGKRTKGRLTISEYSSEFWLNKHISRKNSLFCAILIGGCADTLAGILQVAEFGAFAIGRYFVPFPALLLSCLVLHGQHHLTLLTC